jgi:hypothetical protein
MFSGFAKIGVKDSETTDRFNPSQSLKSYHDYDYYYQLISLSSSESKESKGKIDRLKNLRPFVLDNSIRESTVAQVRGHIKSDKYAIFNAVKATGIKSCIVATFGGLSSIEDQWLEEMRNNGIMDSNKYDLYAFSEIYDVSSAITFKGDLNELRMEPLGLRKSKIYKVKNIIIEINIMCELFNIPNSPLTIEFIAALMKLRIEQIHKFSPNAKIFFNYRDALSAFDDVIGAQRMIYYTKKLANLTESLRPFGIIFEEPTGEKFPWEYTNFCKVLRRTMDDNHWLHCNFLVHVHKNYGFAEACIQECLASGCNGIWCGISEDGAATGSGCSLMTLTNLARMGNKHVIEMFNFVALNKAAREITFISTKKVPHDKQELYGPRALDVLWSNGMRKNSFDELKFFKKKSIIRVSTFTTPELFTIHLSDVFGHSPSDWSIDVTTKMQLTIREDLLTGKKYDYQFSPGLFDLYQRSGGIEYLDEMVNKVNNDNTREIGDNHALIIELHEYFKSFSKSNEGINDETLSYDSFYNAFLAKYISSTKSSLFHDIITFLDINKNGCIHWNEILINAKWALFEYPVESQSWDIVKLIEVVFEERILPYVIQEASKLR